MVVLGVCRCSLAGDTTARAPFVTYAWPAQAGFSDRYKVYVRCGDGPEREVPVLMSKALFKGDYRAKELEGRTFSFAPLSYDPGAGPLTIRAVKRFGAAAESATLHPRSYGIDGRLAPDGKEVVFKVAAASRYVSVHFAGNDNQTENDHWIKHMLCLFVDPLETDVPDRKAAGVVLYSPDVAPEILTSARTIVFPAGYHNLRAYRHGGLIDGDGQLLLQDGQSLYLEGGAFVEGIIGQQRDGWARHQRVYGRGILSGRQYLWSRNPDHAGPEYRQLLKVGGNSRVDGIMVMESPMHGIVGGDQIAIRNLKFLGWHCNNDGIRVNAGSEVSDSFLRAVDDHFYNFHIHVHNVVLWAGHNGSILTYGWGGRGAGNHTYRTGASLLEDIDIIHPEWTHLGNNNGLVMSQVQPDYKPTGYGGSTTTVLRNIRIEGSIPGLVNLKPYTKGGTGEIIAVAVPADKVGYVGDLILENITVDGQFEKSLINGWARASTEGGRIFRVQNVQFKNVRIAGKVVTEANQGEFLNIDTNTTRDITFSGDSGIP